MRAPRSIPNTDWTLVAQAGAAPASAPQKQALQSLLLQYLPALSAHVISKWRVPAERAEELLQAFLAAKVLKGNLIGQARREKGRFRGFIRKTLDDFVISQIRHAAAKKRSPGSSPDWLRWTPSASAARRRTKPSRSTGPARVIAAAVEGMGPANATNRTAPTSGESSRPASLGRCSKARNRCPTSRWSSASAFSPPFKPPTL